MDDMMGVLPDGVAAGPRGGGMMGAGLDPGAAMRMRGEMMRAMGDILVKYADKIPASPPKP